MRESSFRLPIDLCAQAYPAEAPPLAVRFQFQAMLYPVSHWLSLERGADRGISLKHHRDPRRCGQRMILNLAAEQVSHAPQCISMHFYVF
jgi:hypothetical protein